MGQHPARRSVYETVTEQIIAAIEAGAGHWQMPWHNAGGTHRLPRNARTNRTYRGVNVVVLWAAAQRFGYDSDSWATYRQWRELGAQVQKGERGTTVVFYKPLEDGEADDEEEQSARPRRVVTRAHRVFNAAQVEGWTAPAAPETSLVASLAQADHFVNRTGADIRHGGNRAFYAPVFDYIRLPPREYFVGTSTSDPTESYYATALHELVHWSGHTSRVGRDLSGRFGQHAYAMEELVAELGAAFLCADLEISNAPRPDHAAYLASWLEVLRGDARALFTAARHATEATEFLSALQREPSAANAEAGHATVTQARSVPRS